VYHIFTNVSLIEVNSSLFIAFTLFSTISFQEEIVTPKSLSLSSKTIFSAIFFHIHLMLSIVFLSSYEIASINLLIQSHKISIATFHHTPEIFISSVKIFFSNGSLNQNKF